MDPLTNQASPSPPPHGAPYASVVANLFDTGLHQVIFKTISGTKLMEVTEADFADSVALDAMEDRAKAQGSLGTLANERAAGVDLLREVCRHGSNPFKLVGFAAYEPTFFDLAVCAHGSLDGARPVWDQLVAPNLTRLGISVDPGVVARNAPEGLGVQPPFAGGPADPATKALTLALDALRSLENLYVVNPAGPPVQLIQTDLWKTNVAPLLAGPFMSGV